MLSFYNTLGRKKELFAPLKPKNVLLYTCGPTVYARPHIGNYRTYVFEDVVKRHLRYNGYDVRHAMNITDFDDTVRKEARKAGVPRKELTAKYERLFRKDIAMLGIVPADRYPHVTDYTFRMAKLVHALLRKGIAHKDEKGRVFFDISKYPHYGELSGKRISNSRKVTKEEYKRWEAGDFLLWKPGREEGCENCFNTEIGVGYPEWNLQCAEMGRDLLGEQIDIAMGGADNCFNHHENTRAVVSALSGREYARYWMHVGHLIVDGRKMSKSLGNVILLPDLLKRGVSPKEARMLLLSVHYRKKLDYTGAYAALVHKRYGKMRKAIARIKGMKGKLDRELLLKAEKEFEGAMDDDFDVPKALDAVEILLEKCVAGADGKAMLALLKKFDSVLGCLPI